jgi:tRNA (adenine22-N1)-methyltransferase
VADLVKRLSDRLEAILKYVKCRTLADIGTDHGLLPVTACMRDLSESAIACDISPGSLKKAEALISTCGLSSKIETRLGYGFDALKPGEADIAVLSGIGGHLIFDILKNGLPVVIGMDRLILQPQKDLRFLRKALLSVNLSIIDEDMLIDNGFYVNILVCAHGLKTGCPANSPPYSQGESAYGRLLIKKRCPTLRSYLREVIDKNTAFLNIIQDTIRVTELQEEIALASKTLALLEE